MYRIFDLGIISDLPLPELPLVTSASRVLVVSRLPKQVELDEACDWFHSWKTADGEALISCARLGGRVLLRFPGPIDFVVSVGELKIEYRADEQVEPDALRHYLLDQVIPRMLGQSGRLVIHASAVRLRSGQCLGFLGDSGAGKSTMAAALSMAGAALLADDALIIDVTSQAVSVTPSYRGLRLDAVAGSAMRIGANSLSAATTATCNGKLRYLLSTESGASSDNPMQLAALFVLGAHSGANEIKAEPLRGRDSLMAVMRQMFILDVEDSRLAAVQLANKGRLLSSGLPVYRLDYPRDLSRLPQIIAFLYDLSR